MFVLILPFVFWALIFCAPPAYIIEEITTEFIGNLNARDLGQNFPVYDVEVESPKHELIDGSKMSIAILPYDSLSQIFDYMSYEDSKIFNILSKACNFIIKKWVRAKLIRFSPHFLFRNDRLNQLLAFELSRYFNSKTRISDVDVYDQYELTCFKHFSEKGYVSSEKLEYLVQAFIHESLYGSDSPIPTNLSQWKMLLFMKVIDSNRAQIRRYGMSLECIIELNRNIIDEEFDDPFDRNKLNDYLDLFVKFITSPVFSVESLIAFQNEKQNLGLEPRHLEVSFEKEFEMIIQVYFHEYVVPEEQALQVLENIIKSGLYSKSLYDRAVPDVLTSYILSDNPGCAANRMLLKHYHDKFVSEKAGVYHMLVRNPKRPVTQDNLIQTYFEVMIQVSNPSLIFFDTIIKSVCSHLNRFRSVQFISAPISYLAYTWGHDIIFDILFSPSAFEMINVFYFVKGTRRNVNIFNSDSSGLKKTKMRIYLKHLLKVADPLPLIFIKPEWLFDYANLITDKFILNKRYFINITVNYFISPPHLNKLACKRGKIISFKEIIQTLQVPGLSELFSSYPIPDPIESEGAVSVADFIKYGSLHYIEQVNINKL